MYDDMRMPLLQFLLNNKHSVNDLFDKDKGCSSSPLKPSSVKKKRSVSQLYQLSNIADMSGMEEGSRHVSDVRRHADATITVSFE